jgi:hypothetical protein
LQVERSSAGDYVVGYYEATLRKRIDVKDAAGEIDVDIEGLENKMAAVDWADVSALVPGIGALKNQYDISQRFYISEGHGISTEEAYRFLCSKWMEKKMAVKKKQETRHGRV